MAKKADTAWDVTLSADKKADFIEWICRELTNAQEARPVPIPEMRYWWTLYEQGRTRASNAPWQDAADLTSYLGTEKVDALKARIMKTVMVDPVWTVEGWGSVSAKKAPFVEDFHQWALESEGLQGYLNRAILTSLVEGRGVLEVYEDTTQRVTRREMQAQVQMGPDGQFVMDGETMEPALARDDQGNLIEVADTETASAMTVLDEVQRVRKGPGYRVLPYEHFLVLPSNAKEKSDIWGYAKYFTRTVDKLQEAAKQGMYDRQAVEDMDDSPEVTSDLTLAGQPIPVAQETGPKSEKELWEAQVLADLNGKGLRWYVATVHLTKRLLLRLKYDNLNTGRYILIVPFPRADRAHEGYSIIGNKLITVIEEHTAWRNMSADYGAKLLSAPVKRLVNALWDPDINPIGPKSVIDVRDMNEVQPMQMPDFASNFAQNREQENVRASERIIGVNDVALGQTTQGTNTLGEVNVATEQSFVRMDDVIKAIQEPLEDLGQIRQAIWIRALQANQGMTAPQYLFEGLEERGGDPSKSDDGTVTPEMLEGTFRFKPRGSTENADITRQRQDYISFLNVIPIMLQVWPAMAQTIGMNVEAAKSALEQGLRLFRIPDKQAWLSAPVLPPPMPPGMVDPATGQPIAPSMGGAPPGLPGMPPGMPPPGMPPPGMMPPGMPPIGPS